MALSANAEKVKSFFESENLGGSLFGHYDYWNIMKRQVSDHTWTGSVRNARVAALEFLTENQHLLWDGDPGENNGNKPGHPNGLYEFMTSSDKVFSGGMSGPEGDSSQTIFGYYDFIHARSHGKSDEEVLRWMVANPTKIDPGDPGLYRHIYDAAPDRPSDIPSSLGGTPSDGSPPSDLTEENGRFIIPGKGGEGKFGDADYRHLLAATDRTPEALERVRSDVLAWLARHEAAGSLDTVLFADNKPVSADGNENGLHNRILTGTPENDRDEGGRFFTQWGDTSIDEHKDTKFEESDILASRAGGHSTYQIYSHMQRNKATWHGLSDAEENYNTIRNELIERGNNSGNMYGYEGWGQGDYPSDKWFSWKHTHENPLWQEVGVYMKAAGIKSDKSTEWWMYDKDAYREIRGWLEDRAREGGDYSFLTLDDSSRLTRGPSNDDELRILVGSAGVPVREGVRVPSDWQEGKYWSYWGTEGPRRDGELDLAEVQKLGAGLGLGKLNLDDKDIKTKLEAIEQRFLREMFIGVPTSSMDPRADPLEDRLLESAEDSWGLDIVRKGMRPSQWVDGWFNDEGAFIGDFNTLAYGGEETIDWAYYNSNHAYKAAQKALGMDDVIDEIKEIREANMYVYAKVLADADPSGHLENWIAYEPTFDSSTPIPEPQEIDVGDYETPAKDEITDAPEGPDVPTINIPNVTVGRPDNMPENLKIVGGDS